jgi:hypothetical protein
MLSVTFNGIIVTSAEVILFEVRKIKLASKEYLIDKFHSINFSRILGISAGLFATGIFTLEKLEIFDSAEP